METAAVLAVGAFGIATRMVQPDARAGGDGPAPAREAEPAATMIYKPRATPTDPVSPTELGLERELVTLEYEGKRQELSKRRVVIGRSKDCDIQLADPNVSRRHAELRQEGAQYWVVDLGSTNGMEVNGRRARRSKLGNGDTITIGSTDLVFRRGHA